MIKPTRERTDAWRRRCLGIACLIGASGIAAHTRDDAVAVPLALRSVLSASEPARAKRPLIDDEQVVDVVVGYTNGLVTRLGSVSAVQTRIQGLIALTNLAFENSQIVPRLRLVHTVQVEYTDTNGNEAALEALTGVDCDGSGNCSPIPTPAELQPLRVDRDVWGGDLVVLLRPNQAPQHQNCGNAWLLGGGGFTIDNTDAPFGFAVVSDGDDIDESNGFNKHCSDTAFAHEIGHNLGQAHNFEDAPVSGTHAYSYGYREASSAGFHTVMALPLSNSAQPQILHFANPDVTYLGRPTGTAQQNNAASLAISMPLVAQFRAVVVPGERVFRDGFE